MLGQIMVHVEIQVLWGISKFMEVFMALRVSCLPSSHENNTICIYTYIYIYIYLYIYIYISLSLSLSLNTYPIIFPWDSPMTFPLKHRRRRGHLGVLEDHLHQHLRVRIWRHRLGPSDRIIGPNHGRISMGVNYGYMVINRIWDHK